MATSTGIASSMFSDCALSTLESGGDANLAMLQCISDKFAIVEESIANTAWQTRDWLMVYAGALIFFMQAGFAMLVGGCVRKKNLQNTMLKNLLDVCGAAVAFWAVGYAFAYGGDAEIGGITFVGTTNFFGMNITDDAFWFFQFAFCATSVTIVAGTLAERCQMAAYLWYSFFLTGFVYPVVAHTLWSSHGKLSPTALPEYRFNNVGSVDFAGSGVVHLTGGTISFIAAYILGPRVGRFYDARGQKLDTPATIIGHSIPLQVLGTLILWFGWYGFNPGSALLLMEAPSQSAVAARAAANTSLAAASGALSGLIYNLIQQKYSKNILSFNLTITMNGCLSGLVAITAGAATVELWAAVIIGIIAGIIYIYASNFLLYIEMDDAVDAIPVHMCNGAWGLFATGLFTSPAGMKAAFNHSNYVGWFYNLSDGTLLVNQIVAICLIMSWVTLTMMPFFAWLNYMGWFRSNGLEEVVGLDIRYHGGGNDIDEIEMKHDLEQYKELLLQQQSGNGNPNGTNNQQQSSSATKSLLGN